MEEKFREKKKESGVLKGQKLPFIHFQTPITWKSQPRSIFAKFLFCVVHLALFYKLHFGSLNGLLLLLGKEKHNASKQQLYTYRGPICTAPHKPSRAKHCTVCIYIDASQILLPTFQAGERDGESRKNLIYSKQFDVRIVFFGHAVFVTHKHTHTHKNRHTHSTKLHTRTVTIRSGHFKSRCWEGNFTHGTRCRPVGKIHERERYT